MDNLNIGMFRACDIRTPASRLSDVLAARLARAEAAYFRNFLGAEGVLVGHDARRDGPRYLQIAAKEYLAAGLDVVVIPGVVGSCQFYYAAMRRKDLASVLFGASHNPAGDTGRKIMGPGVRPVARNVGPEGGLEAIKRLYVAGEHVERGRRGRISAFDPTPGYLAFSMREAGVMPGYLRGLRILHDYLNGAGGRELMLGFAQTRAELEPLHFAADGSFPLGDPNPVRPDVIAESMERLRGEHYDLGMLFDGDADRLDLYLSGGQMLASSFAYAAVLPAIVRKRAVAAPTVYADLKSNPRAIVEMARSGVSVRLIRNGHSQIKDTMYGDPAAIGCVEESAHFYEGFELEGDRFCTENTLYMALLMARVMADDKDRFAQMSELQATTARQREWGHVFPDDGSRAAALDAVDEHFRSQGCASRSRMDNGAELEATLLRRGVPFVVDATTRLPDEWLQVCQRPSQSEDHLARWEVVGATRAIVADAKRDVVAIATRFGGGPEYVG